MSGTGTVIVNPKTGEKVRNPYCEGCHCHVAFAFGVMMGSGEIDHGCCKECGCPKTEEGFDWFKKTYPDSVVKGG